MPPAKALTIAHESGLAAGKVRRKELHLGKFSAKP
jgi:hypothetical protein